VIFASSNSGGDEVLDTTAAAAGGAIGALILAVSLFGKADLKP